MNDEKKMTIDEAYKKLKYYEDMELRLEKVYGKCDGMLEVIVNNLEKHEGLDIGKPVKAILLTDEDVDKWKMSKWIPVEERLPEEKGVYLVTYHPCYWDDVESEIKVGIDTFMGKTAWSKRKFQRVIAWMPLPEPYSPEPLETRKNSKEGVK